MAGDDSGATVHTASQRSGEPIHTERRDYDASGRPLNVEGRALDGTQAGVTNRVEDVTDRDREYEERIEDEYAKRVGGA